VAKGRTEAGWVALLRAVNLGRRNKVPMAELRRLLAGDGFGDVRSHIASGNLLFTHGAAREEVAARVEELILDAFGVTTVAILRSFAELRKVAAAHPFGDGAEHVVVTFLAEKPSAAAARALAELDTGGDEVVLRGREVYASYPAGYASATVSAATFEKTLGVAGTARNWRTVTALAALTRD
jgi:uncharacterized protein (DUF1697 family)